MISKKVLAATILSAFLAFNIDAIGCSSSKHICFEFIPCEWQQAKQRGSAHLTQLKKRLDEGAGVLEKKLKAHNIDAQSLLQSAPKNSAEPMQLGIDFPPDVNQEALSGLAQGFISVKSAYEEALSNTIQEN